jgi:hypothetical protein
MRFWSKLDFLNEAKNTDGSLVRKLVGALRCKRAELKRVPGPERTVQVAAAQPRGRRRKKQRTPPLGFPSEEELFLSCGAQRKEPAMLGDRGWAERSGITAWKTDSRPDAPKASFAHEEMLAGRGTSPKSRSRSQFSI